MRTYRFNPRLSHLRPYVPGLAPPAGTQEQAVKLSSNENPLGPSPRAVEALQRAAWESHFYPDSECVALRQALGARLQLPVEQIVVANGSDNLLTLIAQALLVPGDRVVIPATTFASYETASLLADATIETVPMRDFHIDARAVAERLRAGASLAFVASPNNPTGTVLSLDELRGMAASVPDGGVLVVDEAYAEFVEAWPGAGPAAPDDPVAAGSPGLALLREGAPVVVLRTFSKAYALAGLRIGYAMAPAPVAATLWQVREPFATSRPALAAALAALDDGAHLQRTREMVASGRRELYALFDRFGLRYVKSQANFVWVETGRPSEAMVAALARDGVLVRPGGFWQYPRWLRISVGTPAQLRRLEEALRRALDAIPPMGPPVPLR